MRLVCQATCYMPVRRGGRQLLDRFEDGDVVEVPDYLVAEYRGSGNFVEDAPATGIPYIIDDGEPAAVVPVAEPAVSVSDSEE